MNNQELLICIVLSVLALVLTISAYLTSSRRPVRMMMLLWAVVVIYSLIALGWATEFSIAHIYIGAVSFILWVGISENEYVQ